MRSRYEERNGLDSWPDGRSNKSQRSATPTPDSNRSLFQTKNFSPSPVWDLPKASFASIHHGQNDINLSAHRSYCYSQISSVATSYGRDAIRQVHVMRDTGKSKSHDQSHYSPTKKELDYLVVHLAVNFNGMDHTYHSPTPTTGSNDVSMQYPMSGLPPPSYRSSIKSLPGASLVNHTGTIDEIKGLYSSPSTSTSSVPRDIFPIPQDIRPRLALPPLFTHLALTDPNITGQPIRFTSTAYEPGSNALKVGCCTFLNLPYGAMSECGLRVESQAPSAATSSGEGEEAETEPKQQVRQQIVQRVIHARTGRLAWLLCAETNVSVAFEQSEVREGLAAATSGSAYGSFSPSVSTLSVPSEVETLASGDIPNFNKNCGDYEVSAVPTIWERNDFAETRDAAWEGICQNPSFGREELDGDIRLYEKLLKKQVHFLGAEIEEEEEDIWLTAALTPSSPTLSVSSSPISHSSVRAPPALAVRDLLSLLDEIKLLHRNFFIMDLKYRHHRGSDPAQKTVREKGLRFSIPWLSGHLFRSLATTPADAEDRTGYVHRVHDRDSDGVGYFDRLRMFKNVMALQLSKDIFVATTTTHTRNKVNGEYQEGKKEMEGATEAFFKRVTLPFPIYSDSQFRTQQSKECYDRAMEEAVTEMAWDVGVYAVPMTDDALSSSAAAIGHRKDGDVKCWVCFLVDVELGALWK